MLTTAAMAHALRIHSSEGTSSCPQSMDGVYISNAISSRGGVAATTDPVASRRTYPLSLAGDA